MTTITTNDLQVCPKRKMRRREFPKDECKAIVRSPQVKLEIMLSQ